MMKLNLVASGLSKKGTSISDCMTCGRTPATLQNNNGNSVRNYNAKIKRSRG